MKSGRFIRHLLHRGALGRGFVFLKVSALLSQSDMQTTQAPSTPIKDTREPDPLSNQEGQHFQLLKLPLSSFSSCVKLQFSHSACWWRCYMEALRPQTDSRCTEWSCAEESSSGRSSSPVEARGGEGLWMSQVRYMKKSEVLFFFLFFIMYLLIPIQFTQLEEPTICFIDGTSYIFLMQTRARAHTHTLCFHVLWGLSI